MKRPTLFASILLAHLTAACAHDPAPDRLIDVVEVSVPTAVSCVPENLPPKPVFEVTRDLLRAAPDAAARYVLAIVGMEERDARLNEVEPTIEGCRAASSE